MGDGMIRLHRPTSEGRRLRYFSGRHLGEDEFDRMQFWRRGRLDEMRRTSTAGALCGLELVVRVDVGAGDATEVSVEPGFGVDALGRVVSLVRPLPVRWGDVSDGRELADGVWVLMLERPEEMETIRERQDACRRTEIDPLLDRRLEEGARAKLDSNPLLSADDVAGLGFEVASGRRGLSHHLAGATLARDLTSDAGVAIAFVGVLGGEPVWFETTAARRDTSSLGAHRALAAHFAERVAEVEHREARNAGEADDAWAARVATELALRWLPAAGRLPVHLLYDRASSLPKVEGLPDGLRVELLPLPASLGDDVVRRELGRDPIDLRAPAGEVVRLLVAVDDDVYRPDLLDVPGASATLIEDLHRAHHATTQTFVAWVDVANKLLAPTKATARLGLAVAQLPAADIKPGLDEIKDLLPAKLESSFARDVLPTLELEPGVLAELDVASLRLPAPEPSDELFESLDETYRATIPETAASYERWRQTHKLSVPEPDAVERAGQAVRLELLGQLLEHVDTRLDSIRDELDGTRDFVLLQRQQLDAQSLNYAALAGGVAIDGSGLQLARKLPYVHFTSVKTDAPVDADDVGPAPAAPMTTSAAAPPMMFGNVQPFTFDAGMMAKAWKSPFSGTGSLSIPHSRTPVTAPAYDVVTPNFGTLEHVKPEVYSTAKAFEEVTGLMEGVLASAKLERVRRTLLEDHDGDEKVFRRSEAPAQPDAGREAPDFGRLFDYSKRLVRWIEKSEWAARSLEGDLRRLTRHRVMLRKTHAVLEKDVASLGRLLKRGADNRDEREEDHAMARELVREDEKRVSAATVQRTDALEGVRALYFVRARRVQAERAWPDPLELRHDDPSDVVPGCGDEHGDVRPELEPFVDALLERPIDDFPELRRRRHALPYWPQLQVMFARRTARLTTVATRVHGLSVAATQLTSGLHRLARQNQVALTAVARPALSPTLSLALLQERSARVLSVQDAIQGRASTLRTRAVRLRNDFERAVACLSALLEKVGASERLAWARAADDDRIDVSDPELWPRLQRLEDASFVTARTLVELVDWMFRQLDDDTSPAGRNALRSVVRAALLVAAYGDPSDLLRGRVLTPPSSLKAGVRLRVALNRTAMIGRSLNLRDAAHRVVGRVMIDDVDGEATTVRLTEVFENNIAVQATSFSVTALMAR